MARPERQQAVLDILSSLKGLEPLKQLFWSELSYQRVNEPLWEAEINERVARLYGLTAEELKIVSAFAEASPFAKATADEPARQGSAVK
jgi:hypothetical protein